MHKINCNMKQHISPNLPVIATNLTKEIKGKHSWQKCRLCVAGTENLDYVT